MRRIEAVQRLWSGVDFLALPEVQLLREYIAIDTSEPDANELPGAEFLARQLAAAGLAPHVERLAGGRANVWAFVEGEDPRAIVLAGHIDVEPAKGSEDWKYPPFGGVIDGPWMYGRGIYDMKSLTIAQLLATIDVARDAAATGRRPKRSILFLATSGEEIGSETGTRWILRAHPELVARMGVVLTEGGVVEATSADEVKYWGIEFAQKRFTEIVFCSADAAQARRPARGHPGERRHRPGDAGLGAGPALPLALRADARPRLVPGLARGLPRRPCATRAPSTA